MKEIMLWLNELPPKERKEATNNMQAQKVASPAKIVPDLLTALLCAFIWEKTPEGYFYWVEVANANNL